MLSESKIRQLLRTDPLWYKPIYPVDTEIKKSNNRREGGRWLISIVKSALQKDEVWIPESGYNWDRQRISIDSVVIHHTSLTPDTELQEISAIQLLNLYVEQFLNNVKVKGQPIYSRHFWYGKKRVRKNSTFACYHYLIKPSGRVIQLVDESTYLRHATNLDITGGPLQLHLQERSLKEGSRPMLQLGRALAL